MLHCKKGHTGSYMTIILFYACHSEIGFVVCIIKRQTIWQTPAIIKRIQLVLFLLAEILAEMATCGEEETGYVIAYNEAAQMNNHIHSL